MTLCNSTTSPTNTTNHVQPHSRFPISHYFSDAIKIYGSFFQSSSSQTGWFNIALSRLVPLNALVNGKCPSGAFFTSYMNSDAPNHRFLRSTSPSFVVHPIFLQNASKSSLLCLHFFYRMLYIVWMCWWVVCILGVEM